MNKWKLGLVSLVRVLTGKVLSRIDTPVHGGAGRVSLRLKRAFNSDLQYVVLALLFAAGMDAKYQYCDLDLDEFGRLVEAASAMRSCLKTGGVTEFGVRLSGGSFSRASFHAEIKANSATRYVVLALKSDYDYAYLNLEPNEFDFFVESALTIRSAVG